MRTFTAQTILSLAMLHPVFQKHVTFNWLLGLSLILIFSISRFAAVVYGLQSGNNLYLTTLFALMIALPFVLLSAAGRRRLKIQRSSGWLPLLYSLLIGMGISTIIYALGQWLYGQEISNWYRYIGESYPIKIAALSEADKRIYFIVFILIGISFSPFGEELLYRGVIHGAFEQQWGERMAAMVDSAAFALVHLAHFGLIYHLDAWYFYPVPALLWMLCMYATGLLFNYCKNLCGSIWGAVVCHMGFNVAMTYLIFYWIF